jgi:hypothetical protein
MADDSKFRAGLDGQDEMSQFPSPANPLDQYGIDPDMARANPDLLKSIGMNGPKPDNDRVTPPTSVPIANNLPSESAKEAGAVGGAGATPPDDDPDTAGRKGLSLLNRNLQSATDTADKMSTATPADVTSSSSRISQLSAPKPLYDASGKRLPETKASFGEELKRGLKAGVKGFANKKGLLPGLLDPESVGATPYSAPNKAYQVGEQKRQQDLGTAQGDYDRASKAWKEQVDAQKAKTGEYRANATLGKDLTTGATGLLNAENKPETEDNKTKAKLVLTQQQFDQRKQQLLTDPTLAALPPLQKALYMANGKLPDPREPNEAEVNAAQIAKAMTVFKMQHNGQSPQTLEEFNSVVASAKGELGKGSKVDQATATNLRLAARLAEQRLKAVQDLTKSASFKYGNAESRKPIEDQVAAAKEEYDDLMGQLKDAGVGPTATPAPAPQATPAPAAAPTKGADEPPRPAYVPANYVFKDGPKGKGWYKP